MRVVALWEAAEKHNEKHISETKIHMKENTRREQTQSCKFNANFSTSPPQTSPFPLPPCRGCIGVWSAENLFIRCCIFLLRPVEEIPEVALRERCPSFQLAAPHRVDRGGRKPRTAPFPYTACVCVCVGSVYAQPCTSSDFTWTPDVRED